jgi:hypothetical protein
VHLWHAIIENDSYQITHLLSQTTEMPSNQALQPQESNATTQNKLEPFQTRGQTIEISSRASSAAGEQCKNAKQINARTKLV